MAEQGNVLLSDRVKRAQAASDASADEGELVQHFKDVQLRALNGLVLEDDYLQVPFGSAGLPQARCCRQSLWLIPPLGYSFKEGSGQ
eukprot:6071537-Pleurochrysis_carterae.AAC.2